jgi:hypothetical protein
MVPIFFNLNLYVLGYLRTPRSFGNPAGFDALSANPNALGLAFDQGSHPLQVRYPAALCLIMCVAYIVPSGGALATNFADTCHCSFSDVVRLAF